MRAALHLIVLVGCWKNEPAPHADPVVPQQPTPRYKPPPDEPRRNDAIVKMEQLRDEICACQPGDRACADAAMKSMMDWVEQNKDLTEQWEGDEELMEQAKPIGEEMMKCYSAAAPSPGPPPGSGGPTP